MTLTLSIATAFAPALSSQIRKTLNPNLDRFFLTVLGMPVYRDR